MKEEQDSLKQMKKEGRKEEEAALFLSAVDNVYEVPRGLPRITRYIKYVFMFFLGNHFFVFYLKGVIQDCCFNTSLFLWWSEFQRRYPQK